jgi:hypothetical protein
MNSVCEFYECGPCGGAVVAHNDIKWCNHPRTTTPPTTPPHVCRMSPMRSVMMCGTHRNKLSVQCGDGEGGIPYVYGFDEADAFDMLINMLDHTGCAKPHHCDECGFSTKYYANETEKACALTCESLLNTRNNWLYDCTCKERVKCVCDLHSNTELHWAITTYSNGFEMFECDACSRPSWKDEHHEYYAKLIPVDTIIAMAKENPNYLEARNASGETPLNLIDFIITHLTYSSTIKHNERAKNREDGWARHNIDCLTKLKKELAKVIEEYNKYIEEWENDWKMMMRV